ncbi:hypothetical protein [Halopelagius fulvigenes]|uniref:Uncharacterized protein n=1 Tax=Halopelagius fulvigenes TaxID=1198324 RepID=A0ABD5U258_9EURY
MSPTRRTLLRTTALSLCGGTLASVAGCLGGSAPTGGTTPEETSSAPTTRDSDSSETDSAVDFVRWLPDPTESPFRDGYGVRYFDVASIRDRRGTLHENAYERLETEILNASSVTRYVDEDAVTATLELGFGTSVVFGSFDPAEFRERYVSERRSRGTDVATETETETPTRTPTSEPERYDGFDVYGAERVFAVSEEAIIEVDYFTRGDRPDHARAVIDARTGETHYPDGNEYVDAMLGLVDEPHALTCYPEAMDGSTSRGFRTEAITGGLKSWRFGPKTTHLTYANTYPDADAAENPDFEAYIGSESDRFGAYDGLDVKTDGRMVWVRGTLPTTRFDHLSPGGPEESVHTPNG